MKSVLVSIIAALSLLACGGGDDRQIVRPTWSAETDTLETFEIRLRAAACPGPSLIDATGFSGARLARIEMVARECEGVIL